MRRRHRFGSLRPALRHSARIMRAGHAVAAQGIEAMRQIGVVPAEAAFADQDGNLGGKECGAFGGSVDHHAGEPRRKRQPAQFPPFLGDAAVCVDGAEFNEQRPRLGKGQVRRRIEEGKLFGRCTPCREVERENRKGRRRGFPGGNRLRAPRSAARPRAGSRCPARCGRRGRGAGRPPRATRARSQAASRRHRVRSAARGQARCR